MDLLLNFIGEPDSSFKFENDENKGFSCLKKPLPFCLNPAKGNSRKQDVYDIFKAKGIICIRFVGKIVKLEKTVLSWKTRVLNLI